MSSPQEPLGPASSLPASRSALCAACGAEATSGQRFCGQCGAPLIRRCTSCGSENQSAHQFCGSCGAPLKLETLSKAPAQPSTSDQREERRWATMLFADLSGFTSMAEKMDPEDVKALAHRCAGRLGEEVRRFGGTVIAVAGDQVFAAFGAPLAHEDDAERAVRAGLAIRDCSLCDNAGVAIKVHIGINTGEVMAGLIGPEECRDYTVMGDTTNLAARLMSAAPPGCALVGEETWRATRHLARYRELPPLSVKGKERPVAVWELLDVACAPKSRPLGTAPLIGRDDELALLSGIWLRVVREARPHLVTILGEPGIGKSRLVAEFERRVLKDASVIHGRCLSYGEALAYGALAAALKESAGVTAEDGIPGARAKLAQLINSLPIPNADAEAKTLEQDLAVLSGLDTAADRGAPAPDQKVLHGSVRRFFEALANRNPLCVCLEDIHWADDSLLDVIEFVAARAKEAPLLILAQARPELLDKRPSWGGGVRGYSSLALEPLSEKSGGDLIAMLCRERGLDANLTQQVGRGAGGNPLFAEELVSMIAERGTGAGIPSAIKAIIAARLDTLAAEQRRTLQIAAVFGKTFWESGLRSLGPPGDVAKSLEGLEQKDLLRLVGQSQFRGQREYVFKHDLIRDVAYETLPRADRRTFHGQIADWMERAASDNLESYFDQLAHHALHANQEERALDYLVRASERAQRAAAHQHEASLLAEAIAIAERRQHRTRVAQLRARRGKVLLNLARWAEAAPELEAALTLLEPEELELRVELLNGLAWSSFWLNGPREIPSQYASEALAVATEAKRADLVADAMGLLGLIEHADGSILKSRDLYKQAIATVGGMKVAGVGYAPLTFYVLGEYDEAVRLAREGLESFRALNNSAAALNSMSFLGLNLAAKGCYREATAVFAEGRRFGQEREIWPPLARCISMSSAFHLDLFDFSGAESLAEEARDLADSAKFRPTIISTGIDLLFNFTRREEAGRAEALVEKVAAEAGQIGGWHGKVWDVRLAQIRAEIQFGCGNYTEALRRADHALLQSQSSGRVKYEVLALWIRARVLQALGRTHEAIADLRRALDIARRIGDPAMILRVATPLLELDGNDPLLAEARSTVQTIRDELPDETMRPRFEAAEPVQRIAKLGR